MPVPCRSKLEELLRENYLTSGGDENIKCFFREEGFHTGISNVIKARGSASMTCNTAAMREAVLYIPAVAPTGSQQPGILPETHCLQLCRIVSCIRGG